MLNILTTLQALSPYHVQCRCWPECPRHCPAKAENLRTEKMNLCSQACVSDEGLVSLAALGPHTLSSHGTNVASNKTKSLGNTVLVTTSHFPFLTFSGFTPLSFYFKSSCHWKKKNTANTSLLHHCPLKPLSVFLILWSWWAEMSLVTQVRWELSALLLTP